MIDESLSHSESLRPGYQRLSFRWPADPMSQGVYWQTRPSMQSLVVPQMAILVRPQTRIFRDNLRIQSVNALPLLISFTIVAIWAEGLPFHQPLLPVFAPCWARSPLPPTQLLMWPHKRQSFLSFGSRLGVRTSAQQSRQSSVCEQYLGRPSSVQQEFG